MSAIAEASVGSEKQEVGDIEKALASCGRLFAFELHGKSETMAFTWRWRTSSSH
jgi:hypothetical protein